MKEVSTPKVPSLDISGVCELNPRFFRPGSKIREVTVNYVLTEGGIGDFICWLSALEWLARNHPQILGRVYCPDFFVEIAANVLQNYPKWKVQGRKALNEKKLQSRPTYLPFLRPINSTGAHLVDLGFIFYANINPPPEDGWYYTRLDLSKIEGLELPEVPYAVLTPGATYENRKLPAKAFNGIKNHLISRGIVPVFLGKVEVGDKRKILFGDDYDYSGGVDLREKTTLLQAAAIMSKAEMVIGLDNGLLHLAAMTDVPIIFGYNIAAPIHRRPRRRKIDGKKPILWEIHPDPAMLTCTFCQSQMRFMFNHDFKNCLYKDNLCLDALSDEKAWCELVDNIINKVVPE